MTVASSRDTAEWLDYDDAVEFFETTGMDAPRAERLVEILESAGLSLARRSTTTPRGDQ